MSPLLAAFYALDDPPDDARWGMAKDRREIYVRDGERSLLLDLDCGDGTVGTRGSRPVPFHVQRLPAWPASELAKELVLYLRGESRRTYGGRRGLRLY